MQKQEITMLLVLVGLAAGIGSADDLSGRLFDGRSWWNHVKYLANDKREGRETGAKGLQDAEAYLVEQLRHGGLEPAGTDGYYQAVRLESRQIVEKDSSLTLIHGVEESVLTLGEDAYFNAKAEIAGDVKAPLVFVGYGLKVPERNYDDLAGLDLRDKIAVVFNGIPEELPSDLASNYQSAEERWKVLRGAGAIGIILILNPASMDIPWSRLSLNRTHPTMVLADPEFDDAKGQKVSLVFNPAKAEQLFAGSGHTFAEIASLGKGRKPLPRFPLGVSAHVNAKVERKDLESANVVARLPGTDPVLRDEYVVLSAHIDHLGIGVPIRGDRIYNGAMDNAAGCAVLLDVASSLAHQAERPRRSVLFLFVTGEEKGHLGSRYFVARPTVPGSSLVADINNDMFLPIVPLKILTIYGMGESTLGEVARESAEHLGVRVQPDPEPSRNLFVRSDQYSFARRGIPAIAMKVGFERGSAEEKVFRDWLTERYHAPSDDSDQPVDLTAAAQYEEVVRALVLAVANGGQKPQWSSESVFRRFAALPGN
jgi:Zn-dependent M28 family amino/carboxypeptidase